MRSVVTFFLLLALLVSGKVWGQLFVQDFSSSTNVSDYVATTPDNTKFNSISTSGSGTVISINSGKLRFERTGNAGSFSRTTDFSPIPTTLQYRISITVSGNTVAQTTAAVFQVGSGFGTANSAEANANTYARFGINFTATDGTWSIRNITGGTSSSTLTGNQVITWVLNNSGSSLTYLSPSNDYESLDDDKADIWAGSTKLFDDIAIQTVGQTITDIKFVFNAGSATIDIDDIIIDPIPIVWKNYGTNSWNTSTNWGLGTVPTSSQNVIIPSGGTQPVIDSDMGTPANAKNLTINSGASLSVDIGKAITVSGTLSNNGTLTLKSDASGTGSLIHSSSGVSATVERYVAGHGNAAAEGWHLMGSPVATFNITGSSFQPGTNDDLYGWSESTNTWLNYKAGNPTQIVPGTGYLVAYENTGTNSFSGTLNVSDVSVSGLAHNASQGKGWHLLGNPFASALEWNKTGGSWALTNISGTAKIWNSTSKTYTDITENGIIPSAQGFFVQVAESTTGSLTIPASARTHSTTAWYKNTTPRILLSASPADGSSKQESQIRLEPEATTGFDFYWDSRFLEGYAPKFYSIVGNEKLSTNAMPSVQNGTSIPFGFEKNQHSNFVIRLEESLPGESIFLKDLKLNTVHNLSQNPEYLFSAGQGDDPNRFLIVFGTVGVAEKPVDRAQLQAYMSNGQLWVNNPAENSQLAVFDLSGRMLVQQQLRGKGLQQLDLNLQKGAYILRLTEGSSSLSTKVINQ